MRLENKPTFLDDNVIKYISKTIEAISEDDFSEETFNEWLVVADVEHKNNPSGYVRSCFKKELDRGTFRTKAKVSYVPNVQELINEIRNKGVCMLADDSLWVSVVWDYLLNYKEIDMKICQSINREILQSLSKDKQFSDYKTMLMNNQVIKRYDVNWKLLEEKIKVQIMGWNKYLDELEKAESEI